MFLRESRKRGLLEAVWIQIGVFGSHFTDQCRVLLGKRLRFLHCSGKGFYEFWIFTHVLLVGEIATNRKVLNGLREWPVNTVQPGFITHDRKRINGGDRIDVAGV